MAGTSPAMTADEVFGVLVPAFAGTTVERASRSALDERLLDHKMAWLGVVAFGEGARLEHLLQLFEHRRTAAHHDAVAFDIERLLADVVEELLRGDEVGDAAAVAEGLAGHGRIVRQLLRQERAEQL